MPQYDICVSCDECGDEHPMGVTIHLNYGPEDKQSLSDTYRGKSFPPQVSAIKGHKCLCLKTGKEFNQEDDRRVFLVPVRWTAVELERARQRVERSPLGAKVSALASSDHVGVSPPGIFDLPTGGATGEGDKKPPATLEELLVSSLAAADALAKLLIEKGLIDEKEYFHKFSNGRGLYQRILKTITEGRP